MQPKETDGLGGRKQKTFVLHQKLPYTYPYTVCQLTKTQTKLKLAVGK